MIFQSAGRITDYGWVAEMAIPFASLRFPDRRGADVAGRLLAQPPARVALPVLVGGLQPRRRMLALPVGDRSPAFPASSRARASSSCRRSSRTSPARSATTGSSRTARSRGTSGSGVTYDISSELSAEATINPDFSQVETDAAQIDVNSTFALFYPEKRPFFQEGSDLFNTYFNAVYTRSINDPIVAGKLTLAQRLEQHGVSLRPRRALGDHPALRGAERVRREREELLQYSAGQARSRQAVAPRAARDQQDLRRGRHGVAGERRRADPPLEEQLVQVPGSRLAHARRSTTSLSCRTAPSTRAASTTTNTRPGSTARATGGTRSRPASSRNTSNYWRRRCITNELSPTFRADNGFEPQNNQRMGSVDVERHQAIREEHDPGVYQRQRGGRPEVELRRRPEGRMDQPEPRGEVPGRPDGDARQVHGEQRALSRECSSTASGRCTTASAPSRGTP